MVDAHADDGVATCAAAASRVKHPSDLGGGRAEVYRGCSVRRLKGCVMSDNIQRGLFRYFRGGSKGRKRRCGRNPVVQEQGLSEV